MGLYDFNPNNAITPQTDFPVPGPEFAPAININPFGLKQLSDIQGGRTTLPGQAIGTHPETIEDFVTPGFRALDEAMKAYWSGIRIPTKDSYRFVRVRIAGGEKNLSFWYDQLNQGRARLPVASINRLTHETNEQKFSPAYHHMARRYTSKRMDQVALIYRPIPYNVDYELIVWTTSKRDAEHILYQIMSRFNPLAEFVMYDEHIQGTIQLHLNGSTDASEKEVSANEESKIRYEYRLTAEAWLPLPERIVPTILGHANIIREEEGDIYLAARGNHAPFFDPST